MKRLETGQIVDFSGSSSYPLVGHGLCMKPAKTGVLAGYRGP